MIITHIVPGRKLIVSERKSWIKAKTAFIPMVLYGEMQNTWQNVVSLLIPSLNYENSLFWVYFEQRFYFAFTERQGRNRFDIFKNLQDWAMIVKIGPPNLHRDSRSINFPFLAPSGPHNFKCAHQQTFQGSCLKVF